MNENVKRCKQCGLLRDLDEFRQYTYSKDRGTTGRHSRCKICENINQKYARAKKGITETDVELVRNTEEMYRLLESHGHATPLSSKVRAPKSPTDSMIADIKNFYSNPMVALQPDKVSYVPTKQASVPEELLLWLNGDEKQWEEAGYSPEFLQGTIYETLKAEYRPQQGLDSKTFLPVYDDTYKEVLNDILRKFDDYEDSFAAE